MSILLSNQAGHGKAGRQGNDRRSDRHLQGEFYSLDVVGGEGGHGECFVGLLGAEHTSSSHYRINEPKAISQSGESGEVANTTPATLSQFA